VNGADSPDGLELNTCGIVTTTYTAEGHHPVHTYFTVSQTDSNGHVFYQSPK
jgi:hypothetical protein